MSAAAPPPPQRPDPQPDPHRKRGKVIIFGALGAAIVASLIANAVMHSPASTTGSTPDTSLEHQTACADLDSLGSYVVDVRDSQLTQADAADKANGFAHSFDLDSVGASTATESEHLQALSRAMGQLSLAIEAAPGIYTSDSSVAVAFKGVSQAINSMADTGFSCAS